MRILITGGCGFIGSAVIRHLLTKTNHEVVNLDKLTYAAAPDTLDVFDGDLRYTFLRADICSPHVYSYLAHFAPDSIMHLAAESHVDRSIAGPAAFIETNIVGTFNLLEAVRRYYSDLPSEAQARFRFHHISTDEVFGSLEPNDPAFHEHTAYDPRSPYSASKAASDHLVRAWGHTYGLPVVVSNTSNNYGPYQFPEKLIPLTILSALSGAPIPVYGNGENIRDWLHVDDHAAALVAVIERGAHRATYCIGAAQPRRNLDVVHAICALLDAKRPDPAGPYARLISYVTDRAGHDQRYEINPRLVSAALGWQPKYDFETGLAATIDWYLANETWWRPRWNALQAAKTDIH
jgi:dTDP-glucose 4,6-dehydratase